VLPLDPGEARIVGADLRSARSELVPAFNPLVTRIVTDHVYLPQEPPFALGDAWYPDHVFAVSTFAVPGTGLVNGQMVVAPFQYRGTATTGELRVFTEMTFEVYYTAQETPADTLAPVIRSVQQNSRPEGDIQLVVQATDNVEVTRIEVLAGETNQWTSVPLELVGSSTWVGDIPGGSFTVRAYDAAGNIAFFNGKGEWNAPDLLSVPLPLPLPRTSQGLGIDWPEQP
jgi:hypothetical protein